MPKEKYASAQKDEIISKWLCLIFVPTKCESEGALWCEAIPANKEGGVGQEIFKLSSVIELAQIVSFNMVEDILLRHWALCSTLQRAVNSSNHPFHIE